MVSHWLRFGPTVTGSGVQESSNDAGVTNVAVPVLKIQEGGFAGIHDGENGNDVVVADAATYGCTDINN